MKTMPIQGHRPIHGVLSTLMLFVFLASLAVSAFHSHDDCVKPDDCVLCAFQSSNFTLTPDPAPVPVPYDGTVIPFFLPPAERVPEPFNTSVFSSHAPPQFC